MGKKIKVSHEVPFCLLNESETFNDYDYCLPHLLDQSEEYRKYFYEAKAKGRYIIMDNSLHELGTAYNTDRLLYWVNELQPDEFIVPDVWENKTASIVNAREWISVPMPKNTTKVAVVQAKSIIEATVCTQTYIDLGYKKIAFSYGASYYNNVCLHPNKDLGKALGRIIVISALYRSKVLTSTDRVHLLGCSVPQEFSWYKGIDCIESIDTSNPIMAGIEGRLYSITGLDNKPIVNMNEAQGETFNRDTIDLIYTNIKMFKVINGLK